MIARRGGVLAVVIGLLNAPGSVHAQTSAVAGDPAQTPPLLAVATAPTTVTLRWQPVSGSAGYTIFRRAGLDGAWCFLGAAAPGADAYEDVTVRGSRTYLYYLRPRAGEAIDRSAALPVAIVTTPASPPHFQNDRPDAAPAVAVDALDVCARGDHEIGGALVRSGAERVPGAVPAPAWLIELENELLYYDPLANVHTAHPGNR